MHLSRTICNQPRKVAPLHSISSDVRTKYLNTSSRTDLRWRGSLSDLDEAIKLHTVTLAQCTPGHFPRFEYINDLATSLRDRFQQQGTLSKLEDTIEPHRATLAFCPPHHSFRSNYINDLAVSLCDRIRWQGVVSDLNEAIER
ncbi:hypothetical protein F4604DRAFT_1708531 [Suillus subluteus]|nr:hypothetical protein F4604DRAFT_1708531 [Suillus subluteus]